jgi:predicted nucleic acid-binding protein
MEKEMKIGVDSSVLVAGVHANHPLHKVAADWLIRNIPLHKLIVTHHSILETYAVLTRLPGGLRLSGSETKQLLESTIKPNMQVADFSSSSIWGCIDTLVHHSAVGGRSYDVFIVEILKKTEVDAIATFNASHFSEFADQLSIIDPARLV